jgi:hypothetical protein
MGMFICQWCVAQASQLAVEDPAEGSMRLEVSGLEVRCSFCGKEAWQGCSWSPAGWRGAWWQFGQGARICDESLDLCGESLADTSS